MGMMQSACGEAEPLWAPFRLWKTKGAPNQTRIALAFGQKGAVYHGRKGGGRSFAIKVGSGLVGNP